MEDQVEQLKAFQDNLSQSWVSDLDRRQKLLARDLAIVTEFRLYCEKIALTILRVVGEALFLDTSDRQLDLSNGSTQIDVIFRQEEFRHYKFAPLKVRVVFEEHTVCIQGGQRMSRQPQYFLPEFNVLVSTHFRSQQALMLVASDYGSIRV